jgi:Uma2 family endonuclease
MSTGTRVTIEEYDRMIEAGAFEPAEEHHVELIRGEIREMSPIHPPHEDALDRLVEWSFDHTSRGEVRVRVQLSVGIPELESVPQPDMAWVRRRDYSKRRPTSADVLLIVEVSDSSLRFDRGEKADLYAEAGVQDYWVVNVRARTIEVRRQPREGCYEQLDVAHLDDEVSPLAYPDLKLRVAELFPAE